MMNWDTGGWGSGDWVAMSTIMVVFLGVLIAFAAWVVRSARSDRGSSGSVDSVDTLLAERFARGEIDGEEFTRSRELLRRGGALHSPSGR